MISALHFFFTFNFEEENTFSLQNRKKRNPVRTGAGSRKTPSGHYCNSERASSPEAKTRIYSSLSRTDCSVVGIIKVH